MHAIVQPNFHQEISLQIPVVCQPREVPRMVQIIHQRRHKHTQIFPRIFSPRNYKRQEHGLALHYGAGREIERNNKYGPAAVWIGRHTIWIEPITCYSNSDIPSLGCFLRVLYIERLPCFPPDGCMIFFGLYLIPSLCHFIILADSFVMKRRCSLFIKSRYRRTFTGIFSCCF